MNVTFETPSGLTGSVRRSWLGHFVAELDDEYGLRTTFGAPSRKRAIAMADEAMTRVREGDAQISPNGFLIDPRRDQS